MRIARALKQALCQPAAAREFARFAEEPGDTRVPYGAIASCFAVTGG